MQVPSVCSTAAARGHFIRQVRDVSVEGARPRARPWGRVVVVWEAAVGAGVGRRVVVVLPVEDRVAQAGAVVAAAAGAIRVEQAGAVVTAAAVVRHSEVWNEFNFECKSHKLLSYCSFQSLKKVCTGLQIKAVTILFLRQNFIAFLLSRE